MANIIKSETREAENGGIIYFYEFEGMADANKVGRLLTRHLKKVNGTVVFGSRKVTVILGPSVDSLSILKEIDGIIACI